MQATPSCFVPVKYNLIFSHLCLGFHCVFFHGRGMFQAVSCRLFTKEARVQSQASVNGMRDEKGETGTGFSKIILVFPCQYSLTSAQYSFIHLLVYNL
jgi:hypothetical protein